MSDHDAPIPPPVVKPHPEARMMQAMTGEWLWAVPCEPPAPAPAREPLCEDICPACLAVSMVPGDGQSGQLCARCQPSAEPPAERAVVDVEGIAMEAADACARIARLAPSGKHGRAMLALILAALRRVSASPPAPGQGEKGTPT
jgi:hypothetical protein